MSDKRLTDFETLEQKIKELKPGDHLCCIYETEQEHRTLLTPFMKQGLDRGEKIVYIVDARSAEQILSYLREVGLDVKDYLNSGQLNVLSVDESYMLEGVFDPDGMIRLLEKETRRALDEGYSALRVTGEMSWVLRGLPGSERLMEYESKLNNFFPGNKCLAICQYDRRKFKPEILLDILTTHPIVVIGTEVFDNYYYVSPKELRVSDPETARLNNWLLNLKARKIIDKTLRESERKYRLLVDNSYDVVYSVKPDGIITFVSPQIKHFGYSPEEVISKHFLEFVVPEMRENILHEFEGGTANREIFPTVFQWQGKDGPRYWVEVVGMTEYDESGHPLLQTGVMRDITDRKNTEDALQESEKTARAFLNATTDSGILLDREGLVIDLNDKMARSLGKTRRDMIGKVIYDYLPAELAERRKAMGFAAAGKREPIQFEDQRENRWFENNVYPIFDPDGEVERFAIFSRDITERKVAEEALKAEKEFTETALNTQTDTFFVFEPSTGRAIRWNEAFRVQSGYSDEEIRSKKAPDSFYSKEDLDKARAAIAEILDGETTTVELNLITKDGRAIPTEYTGSVIMDRDGTPSFIIAVGRDITERQRAERALQQSEKRFRALVEGLGQGYVVFMHDMDGKVKYLSPAIESLIGVKPDQLIGRHWKEYVEWTDKALAAGVEWGRKIRETGQPSEPFIMSFRSGGNTRYMEIAERPTLDDAGNIVGIEGIAKEVTEEIRAIESLRMIRDELEMRVEERTAELRQSIDKLQETELRYRTVAEFNYDWEYWENPDLTLKYVSPSCKRLTGYKEQEFIDNPGLLTEIILGQDRSIWEQHRADALTEFELREIQFRIRTKDGKVRWIGHACRPVLGDQGEFLGFRASNRDITERKQVEEALRESEAVLRRKERSLARAQQIAHLGNWDWDIVTNELLLSDEIYRIFGLQPQEFDATYEAFLESVHIDDRESVQQAVNESLADPNTDYSIEHRVVRPDGSERTVHELGEVTFDKNGKAVRMVGIVHDITERKRAEAELMKSREGLRILAGRLLSVQEEERRRLARELHDDLTQRLAVLAIDIGKLERQLDSSPELLASKIKEIRERTIELSTDIHDISRQLHPAILDDLGLRQAIQSECVNFTKREGIKINYKPKDVPLMIPRDVSVCMFRIVQEGLRNIAKYAKVKEASVSLIGNDGNITLIVRDSGAGFDMARSVGERGVGLTSMQERVHLIRGDFSIKSKPGQGTVIKVVASLSGK